MKMECMVMVGGTDADADGKMCDVETGTSLLRLGRRGEKRKNEKMNATEGNQDSDRNKEN